MLEVQVYVTTPGLFLMYFRATCSHQWLSSLNSLVPISLIGFAFIPSDTGDNPGPLALYAHDLPPSPNSFECANAPPPLPLDKS